MKVNIQRLGVIFMTGWVFLAAGLAYAGVGVSPTITEIIVPLDKVTRGIYTVVNSANEPLCVKVEPEDWLKQRTGVGSLPVEDWLTVTPMEFDIEPQGVTEVEYAIAPPASYKGELIAMVFFAAAVPTEGAFDITSRFGVSIYAAVEGTITLACNIDNIKVKNSGKGIIFTMDLENQGNVHLRPTGYIDVAGEDGTRDRVTIERGFPVYPGSKLNYAIRWKKKDVPPGRYEANLKVDYGKIFNEDKVLERKVAFVVGEDGKVL